MAFSSLNIYTSTALVVILMVISSYAAPLKSRPNDHSNVEEPSTSEYEICTHGFRLRQDRNRRPSSYMEAVCENIERCVPEYELRRVLMRRNKREGFTLTTESYVKQCVRSFQMSEASSPSPIVEKEFNVEVVSSEQQNRPFVLVQNQEQLPVEDVDNLESLANGGGHGRYQDVPNEEQPRHSSGRAYGDVPNEEQPRHSSGREYGDVPNEEQPRHSSGRAYEDASNEEQPRHSSGRPFVDTSNTEGTVKAKSRFARDLSFRDAYGNDPLSFLADRSEYNDKNGDESSPFIGRRRYSGGSTFLGRQRYQPM
ncbi:uncharacterized protein [Apostichopus japonicus]|uniref:uncharacterized protein n=1 Tax=Stichopus japonicus TaxID=307972 RepID=UPI003AB8DEA6